MDTKTLNVLLIEDSPNDAGLILKMLTESSSYHFNLESVDRLSAGLKHLAGGGIDAVLLDLGLPDGQGLNTLQQVRAKAPEVPIVVLADIDNDAIAIKALQEGCQNYLAKGDMDTNLLTVAIHCAILRKQAEEELQRHRDHLEELAMERTVALVSANEQLYKEIAERKQTEAALRTERDKAQKYLDIAGVMFVALNDRGEITLINQKGCTILGCEEDGLIGKNWFDTCLPVSIREDVKSVFQKLMTGELEASEYNENLVLTKYGKERIIAWHNTLLRDEAGNIVGTLGSGEDITERTRAEEAVKRYILQLELINTISRQIATVLDLDHVLDTTARLVQENFDYQHVGIFIFDQEQRMLAMRARAGIYAHRFPADHYLKWGEGMVGWVAQHGEKLLANDVSAEPRYQNPFPDETIQAELSIPIQISEQIIGVFDVQSRQIDAFGEDDIMVLEILSDQLATAIQNARLYEELEAYSEFLEQAVKERTADLRRSKKRLETILDNSSDAIILADTDGRIQQTNAMVNQLFACQNDDFFRQPLTALVTSDYTGAIRNVCQTAVEENRIRRLEVIAQRKDGTTFHAEIGLSPIDDIKKHTGIVCNLRDITERKQAEAKLLEALEREKELNRLKTRFVSMVSHDFRNPLATIQVTTETLKNYLDRMDEQQRLERFDRIVAQIQHMNALLEKVLTIGRLETGTIEFNPARLDFGAFCQDIVQEFQSTTGATHNLIYSYENGRVQALIDKTLMRRIITNLLSNAIKYSPEGSPIHIDLSCESDKVMLCVADTGIGIPEEDRARLFEAFHRAANVGAVSGTGLGLAIVKQAVDLHGGTVTCESKIDAGTSFTITIPSICF